MAEEPRKRSRFDVGPSDAAEPPARRSRFDVGGDRRSRSPGAEGTAARERSPIKSTESPATPGDGDKAKDAATKAAEAAARINAQLQQKKAIQTVDVPPIRQSPSTNAGAAKSPSADPAPSGTLNAEIYQQDGDFIKDIEVNDLRNRYTLTKGSTQKMATRRHDTAISKNTLDQQDWIKDETGADVTTRGNYYPDKSMATPQNPPLYLHVTSTTKDGLEKAVQKIEELMKQELPDLIDQRRFRKPREEQPQVERDHLGRRKWPEERIPIDLEPIPGFNLRAQVVGSGGSYVKHIQQETRCRVQIKGRGSGFLEHDTGAESDEQMYLHVAGPEQSMVDSAKEMCISLLDAVKEAYENFKERGPPNRGGHGGGERGGYHGHGGDRHNSGSYGGNGNAYGGGGSAYGGGGSAYGGGGNSAYGGYDQNYGQQAYGTAQSPTTVQAQAQAQDPAEQLKQYHIWSAYYQQNPSEDPMIAYGGYATAMSQWAAAWSQQVAAQSQTPTNGSAPPPPPPDDSSYPPPPPPPGAANSNYSAVPPPPPGV